MRQVAGKGDGQQTFKIEKYRKLFYLHMNIGRCSQDRGWVQFLQKQIGCFNHRVVTLVAD